MRAHQIAIDLILQLNKFSITESEYKKSKMTQEQLRMQMLAGIITESQYKEKLNESLQKVTLYASYFNPRIPWEEDEERKEEWENHLESGVLFPIDYYKSTGKLIPVYGKGLNMEDGRIGCQFSRFPLSSTGYGPPDSEIYVEFEKPINEVYLDDDIAPEYLVNDVKGFKEWYKGKSEDETGKPVSLADISQFGINTSEVGYGLYVTEINKSEVKSIESGFEGLDLKPFKI
jgi:hypothetical protein